MSTEDNCILCMYKIIYGMATLGTLGRVISNEVMPINLDAVGWGCLQKNMAMALSPEFYTLMDNIISKQRSLTLPVLLGAVGGLVEWHRFGTLLNVPRQLQKYLKRKVH